MSYKKTGIRSVSACVLKLSDRFDKQISTHRLNRKLFGLFKPLCSFLVMSLFCAGVVCAQESSTPADEAFPRNLVPKKPIAKWNVGAFGGFSKNHHDINVWYASDMKYSDMSGYSYGLTGSYHFTGWLSLRADAAMVQKNYRLDRDNHAVSYMYSEYTNDYLSLPVTAVVSLGRTVRLCGFFGGYVGYWLLGHRVGVSTSVGGIGDGDNDANSFDQEYEFDEMRDNRFDAGLVYGAGLRCALFRKIDLSAELRWYYGLTDIQKDYMLFMNHRYNTTRVLQFGASYWF